MKKGKILSIIKEHTEESKLVNMNDDSFYDGYKFVDYGKNIPNISLIQTPNENIDYSVDKQKVVINWGAKFIFRNSGIEGTQFEILNLVAPIVGIDSNDEQQEITVNYGEYNFEITKEKNVESQDVEMYVSSIEIDLENKIVNVVITI